MNESSSPLTFDRLPTLAKVAVALALFDSWVIFEEGIVDRFGLWKHMPLYVKAQFCPWDLAALGAVFVPLLLWPYWRRRQRKDGSSERAAFGR